MTDVLRESAIQLFPVRLQRGQLRDRHRQGRVKAYEEEVPRSSTLVSVRGRPGLGLHVQNIRLELAIATLKKLTAERKLREANHGQLFFEERNRSFARRGESGSFLWSTLSEASLQVKGVACVTGCARRRGAAS